MKAKNLCFSYPSRFREHSPVGFLWVSQTRQCSYHLSSLGQCLNKVAFWWWLQSEAPSGPLCRTSKVSVESPQYKGEPCFFMSIPERGGDSQNMTSFPICPAFLLYAVLCYKQWKAGLEPGYLEYLFCVHVAFNSSSYADWKWSSEMLAAVSIELWP